MIASIGNHKPAIIKLVAGRKFLGVVGVRCPGSAAVGFQVVLTPVADAQIAKIERHQQDVAAQKAANASGNGMGRKRRL